MVVQFVSYDTLITIFSDLELKVFWQFKVKVIKLQSHKFANIGLYCLSCALEACSVTGLLGVILGPATWAGSGMA